MIHERARLLESLFMKCYMNRFQKLISLSLWTKYFIFLFIFFFFLRISRRYSKDKEKFTKVSLTYIKGDVTRYEFVWGPGNRIWMRMSRVKVWKDRLCSCYWDNENKQPLHKFYWSCNRVTSSAIDNIWNLTFRITRKHQFSVVYTTAGMESYSFSIALKPSFEI